MNRIRRGFESSYRQALRVAGARRMEKGLAWLFDRVNKRLSQKHGDPVEVMAGVLEELQACLERHGHRFGDGAKANREDEARRLFLCDAGLGGLARWLRSAGYDARWFPGIHDGALIERTREAGGTLVTTDSMMMERVELRDGLVPAVWVPPTIGILPQLRMLLRGLHLPVRDPRCMACGGTLEEVAKEEVWGRIPPRTRLWRERYFACQRCGKLFWHGTHWRRIERALEGLAATCRDQGPCR